MIHARAANIRCDRYCSNFLDFEVQLNKALLHYSDTRLAVNGRVDQDQQKLLLFTPGKETDLDSEAYPYLLLSVYLG